jgi:hypothetical protein
MPAPVILAVAGAVHAEAEIEHLVEGRSPCANAPAPHRDREVVGRECPEEKRAHSRRIDWRAGKYAGAGGTALLRPRYRQSFR